jgi:hypothetical protein
MPCRGEQPEAERQLAPLRTPPFGSMPDDDERPLPSLFGCTTTRLGCFKDSCGGDCGSAPRAQDRIMDVMASGACGGWQDTCAEPAVACGCGVCTSSADTPCPAAVGKKDSGLACPTTLSEPCSKDEMTNELCLGICSALDQNYYGIEAGSQCFCGNRVRNQAAAGGDPETKTACGAPPSFPKGCTGDAPDAFTTGCACTGKPSEVCGGYRYLEAYEIHGSCSAAHAGTTFSLVVLLCLALYVTLGVAWGRRASGSGSGGLSTHPHFAQWMEIVGLCQDGVVFARGRASSRSESKASHAGSTQYGSVAARGDRDNDDDEEGEEEGGKDQGEGRSRRSGKRGVGGKRGRSRGKEKRRGKDRSRKESSEGEAPPRPPPAPAPAPAAAPRQTAPPPTAHVPNQSLARSLAWA